MPGAAPARAADPQYEDRRERALGAVARGMLDLADTSPALPADDALSRAVSVALLRSYMSGLEDGRTQSIRLLQILLGDYIPTAPPADRDAMERFIGYIRDQYGITDADLADD